MNLTDVGNRLWLAINRADIMAPLSRHTALKPTFANTGPLYRYTHVCWDTDIHFSCGFVSASIHSLLYPL